MPYYGHKKTAAKPQVLNEFEPPKKGCRSATTAIPLDMNCLCQKKATN